MGIVWNSESRHDELEVPTMIVSNILFAIAIASVLWGVASAVMIAGALQKRGIKVNWIFLRLLILSKYLGQYRDITRQETGRTGRLFYSYIVAMNVALVTAILGFVFRAP
jgi:hypothetical protein